MSNFINNFFLPITLLFALITLFYFYLFAKPKKQEEFVTDKSKSSEDDFIEYIKLAAKKEKIRKRDFKHFCISRHTELREKYVTETRRALLVNNIEKLLKKLG